MSGERKTRILIVDDHPDARSALKALLQDEFDIVGDLASAEALQRTVQELAPDIVLLDISMPKVNGLTAARRLREAGIDVKIIFVTEHGDPQYVKEAFRAGGSGFVVKSRAPAHIRKAIHRVMGGEHFPSDQELQSEPRSSPRR